MKQEKIWVKCSEEQKRIIKAQAEEAGATMSDYILSKLLGLELTENKDSSYRQVVGGHEYKITYNKKRRKKLMDKQEIIKEYFLDMLESGEYSGPVYKYTSEEKPEGLPEIEGYELFPVCSNFGTGNQETSWRYRKL